MRLRHLQLQGYKTFATKTEFLFPSGITAIVGPNGSGKSNIADAIRWVLGEQSYTTLRGKRTEDMIFSGSQSRPRAGMAEVTLTLDNSDRWLPLEFSEVTVSRRAFRDGQNEYLINNNRVRLRDIAELLSQSGLSRRTYTIIGQGVVDSVLSLRAQERRELFEEAAGIAHYREQRQTSLRKLDETQHNLERVHDIITELEPRLNRLQQQAARAQEHSELSDHLEQLLHTWYGFRWNQATAALRQAQHLVQQRAERHERHMEEVQALSDGIDRLRQAQTDLRQELGDWHRLSSGLHTKSEDSRRDLAVLTERRRQLAAQREEFLSETSTLDARVSQQYQRLTQVQTELTATQQTLAAQENAVQMAQTALDTRNSERENLIRAQNALFERQTTLRTQIAERQSRQETLAERVETLITEAEANEAELRRLSDEMVDHSNKVGRVEAQLTQLTVEMDEAQATQRALEQRLQELMAQRENEEAKLSQIRETEANVAARYDLLSQLRHDFSIYGQAARSLLTKERRIASPDIHGVLAQLIEIPATHPSGIPTAVEAALGAYAGAIVVSNWRAAARALHLLRTTGVTGRVIFLTLTPVTTKTDLSTRALGTDLPALSSQVDCSEMLRPLVERLLGLAFLVPDLEAAHSALPHLPPEALCVTPEGEVLRSDGIVEGGRAAEQTSPVAQEQEWSKLHVRRIELGAQRETLEAAANHTKAAWNTLQTQLAEKNVAVDELRARQAVARTVRDQIKRHTDGIRQEIDWRRSQLATTEADLKALRERQVALTSEREELVQALNVAAADIQQTNTMLETLPTDVLREELTSAQMALIAAHQTRQGQEAFQKELEAELRRISHERQIRRRRIDELTQEENAAAERITEIAESQAHITDQLDALMAKIESAEERLLSLEKEQRQLESNERFQQARLREFEGHLTSARLEAERREDDVARLRQRIEEDLGLMEIELGPDLPGQSPLPLHPLVSKLPIIQQLPEGLDDEIKRVRVQLHSLGAINPNAPNDYQEIKERYNFLQEQSSDLIAAIDSLRQVIAELDGLIEHAFRQTFEAVALEFSATFTALFDGGRARLELTDPDDLTHTGVEIVAQPPGKRLQTLASLSGGERALTAVALIFSILKVSPTPFCILDEVDAMLDEANIGRFRSLLEALTEHTQVVIITHNRGTISSADTVYGISMGPDSISQTYSMRMNGQE